MLFSDVSGLDSASIREIGPASPSHGQKSAKGAPPYSLYINRPLGRRLATAADALGLRPNQVTMISAAFTFGAIVLLAVGPASLPIGILVALGLVIGYALDSADGQLARRQGGGSTTGEWLDHMIDSVKVSALHVAVLIVAFRQFELPHPAWLLVPLLFVIVSAVHFFGMVLVDLVTRVHRAEYGSSVPAGAGFSRRTTLLKLPTDYGVLCLSFVLLGIPSAFLLVYSFLALASTGYLILVSRKWMRDVQALDAIAGVGTR